MKKIGDKQTLKCMTMLMITVFALFSCMSDDNIEKTPECAITGFTVNNITCNVPTKKYDQYGNATDTIVEKTMYGIHIHFNIDQLKGHIYTTDSLPNWVDLREVIPNTSSWGDVYYKLQEDDELYYPLISGSTVLDFSKTVELLCSSTDGLSKRIYKVDIYKYKSNIDTLEWTSNTSDLSITGESKAFHLNGKVYLFAQNEAKESVATWANSDDATTWSTPVTIPVSSSSITVFNNNFYGLDKDGYICQAAPEQLAGTWTKVSTQQVKQLLAADAYNLYAFDGTAIIGSADLTTWTEQGDADLEMLPESSVNFVTHPSTTNQNIQVTVLTGISSQNDQHGVTWYKTSTSDVNTDQPWAYIQVTPDNTYGMPHFDHPSVTLYNGALYAIGVEEGAYAELYRSDDNGITWHSQAKKYPVPEDLNPANGVASIVAVDKNLWIIQENGKVWQGSIQ